MCSLDNWSEGFSSEDDFLNTTTIYIIEGLTIGHDRPVDWKIVNRQVAVTSVTSVKDRQDSKEYNLPGGQYLKNAYVFIGKGTKKPLNSASKLVELYGGETKEWFHATGNGWVDTELKRKYVQVHWFGNNDIGAVSREITKWFPELKIVPKSSEENKSMDKNQVKEDKDMKEGYYLTESGIDIGNGIIIPKGLMVKTARELKAYNENQQYDDFKSLLDLRCAELSHEERGILLRTVITEAGESIFDTSLHIEHMLVCVPELYTESGDYFVGKPVGRDYMEQPIEEAIRSHYDQSYEEYVADSYRIFVEGEINGLECNREWLVNEGMQTEEEIDTEITYWLEKKCW